MLYTKTVNTQYLVFTTIKQNYAYQWRAGAGTGGEMLRAELRECWRELWAERWDPMI